MVSARLWWVLVACVAGFPKEKGQTTLVRHDALRSIVPASKSEQGAYDDVTPANARSSLSIVGNEVAMSVDTLVGFKESTGRCPAKQSIFSKIYWTGRWTALMLISPKGYEIPELEEEVRTVSPFHDISDQSSLAQLGRLLFVSFSYAYMPNNHYKYRGTFEPDPLPMTTTFESNIRDHGADAMAMLFEWNPRSSHWVTPHPHGDDTKRLGAPIEWYFDKLLGREHQGITGLRENHKYLLVGGRGMRFSVFKPEIPHLRDVVEMRGLTTTQLCVGAKKTSTFIGAYQLELPGLTVGACDLLVALDRISYTDDRFGLIDSILATVQQWKRDKSNRIHILFGGLSFGAAIAQSLALALGHLAIKSSAAREILSGVHIGAALFGSPRIGNAELAGLYDDIRAARAEARSTFVFDQFILHSYTPKNARIPLKYDPIAMWPRALVPIGRLHSLHHFFTNSVEEPKPYTRILHDLEWDSEDGVVKFAPLADEDQDWTALSKPRKATTMDRSGFNCLHAAPIYQAFFENRVSRRWCFPGPLRSGQLDESDEEEDDREANSEEEEERLDRAAESIPFSEDSDLEVGEIHTLNSPHATDTCFGGAEAPLELTATAPPLSLTDGEESIRVITPVDPEDSDVD